MNELLEWADQYQSELYKQSSERAALIKVLLDSADYQTIKDYLEQWESEDAAPDSPAQKYRRTLDSLQSLIQTKIKDFRYDHCR